MATLGDIMSTATSRVRGGGDEQMLYITAINEMLKTMFKAWEDIRESKRSAAHERRAEAAEQRSDEQYKYETSTGGPRERRAEAEKLDLEASELRLKSAKQEAAEMSPKNVAHKTAKALAEFKVAAPNVPVGADYFSKMATIRDNMAMMAQEALEKSGGDRKKAWERLRKEVSGLYQNADITRFLGAPAFFDALKTANVISTEGIQSPESVRDVLLESESVDPFTFAGYAGLFGEDDKIDAAKLGDLFAMQEGNLGGIFGDDQNTQMVRNLLRDKYRDEFPALAAEGMMGTPGMVQMPVPQQMDRMGAAPQFDGSQAAVQPSPLINMLKPGIGVVWDEDVTPSWGAFSPNFTGSSPPNVTPPATYSLPSTLGLGPFKTREDAAAARDSLTQEQYLKLLIQMISEKGTK